MIVGRGLIAGAFEKITLPHNVLVFASGVSNSKETNQNQFQRELELLTKTIEEHPNRRFVYFSTASVLDPQLAGEPYVLHKLRCEELIRTSCRLHLILRVTNVVGRTGNPNTVFNFFVDQIRNQTFFELWNNACRNLIDIEDVVHITRALLEEELAQRTFLLVNPTNHSVADIVHLIEETLGKKANCAVMDKGSCIQYELSDTQSFYEERGFLFAPDYLNRLVAHYVNIQ